MNERWKELAKQCWDHRIDGTLIDGHLHFDQQKFAELIIQECSLLNKKQSYELAGVIEDVELGLGFDEVCMNTVKQVENYLADSTELFDHFGIKNESK